MFKVKNRKAKLKQQVMLACFLIDLGQLPLRIMHNYGGGVRIWLYDINK